MKREEALQKQIEAYHALHRVLQEVGSSLEVGETLERIIRGALTLSGADQGSIVLFDPKEQNEVKTLLRGHEDAAQTLDHYLNSLLSGWVSRHRRPLLTNDLQRTFPKNILPQKYRTIHSALAVPLEAGSQLLGVLNLINLKPQAFEPHQLEILSVLATQCAQCVVNARLHEELFAETSRLRREVRERYAVHGILGRSPKMQELFALLDRVIPTDGRVLLEGESGTGKELVARVLHYNGPRKDKPFVAVDCGAMPATLLESELFGYVKGAFTGAQRDKKGLFEEAHGGTLFLDEIVNMPLDVQAKLLRAIEQQEIRPVGATVTRKVDVRIIAAASHDLRSEVQEGRFREDLYYRLNVVPIRLPPLRHRKEDIPLLADHFLEGVSRRYRKAARTFAPETMAHLETYDWPGNVRELENTVERMVILAPADASVLTAELLPTHIRSQEMAPFIEPFAQPGKRDLRAMKDAFERFLIRQALEKHGGNQSAAAKELGISERTVRYKMSKLGLKTV